MVHHLGFGGRVPPDLPPQNCAPERELAATRRGSRTSPAKPSRILFLIANRIMSIYTRFRSDQVLNIGNYLCPTSADRLVRCQQWEARPRSLTAVRDGA